MSRKKPTHYNDDGLRIPVTKPKGTNKTHEKRIERALHRRDASLWLNDDADL